MEHSKEALAHLYIPRIWKGGDAQSFAFANGSVLHLITQHRNPRTLHMMWIAVNPQSPSVAYTYHLDQSVIYSSTNYETMQHPDNGWHSPRCTTRQRLLERTMQPVRLPARLFFWQESFLHLKRTSRVARSMCSHTWLSYHR